MKKCYIFGAGEIKRVYNPPICGDLVIAADGGIDRIKEFGIIPDISVGDFDSAKSVPSGNVKVYPVEKDDTDSMIAIKEGLAQACDMFVIYGGLGGRLDHTVANIQSLAYIAQNGGQGFLVGDGIAVTVIKNCDLTLPGDIEPILGFEPSSYPNVSVFAFGGDAHGVSEKGLKYSLDNAVLHFNDPMGVSNTTSATSSSPAVISVSDGLLLITVEFEN